MSTKEVAFKIVDNMDIDTTSVYGVDKIIEIKEAIDHHVDKEKSKWYMKLYKKLGQIQLGKLTISTYRRNVLKKIENA